MAELADAHDSKSCEGDLLRVRLPPSALSVLQLFVIQRRSPIISYNTATSSIITFFPSACAIIVDARACLATGYLTAGRTRPRTHVHRRLTEPSRRPTGIIFVSGAHRINTLQ